MNSLYYTVLLLFLQYSIYLNFMPKSRYIAIVMIFIAYVYVKIRSPRYTCAINSPKNKFSCYFGRDEIVFSFLIGIVLLYTCLITLIRGAWGGMYTTGVSTTFNYFIMLAVLPPFMFVIIPDKTKFCNCYVNATLIQSIIVILSFSIPQVREWLMANQNADIWENFSRYNWRIIGLGVVGAGGSVYLFCGFVCVLYKLIFLPKKITVDVFKAVIMLFAIALVGRTGFYAAIVLTIYCLIKLMSELHKFAKVIKSILLIIIVTVTMMYIFGNDFLIKSRLFEYTFGRLGEIFEDENTIDEFSNVYSNSDRTPPISIYTLFGSGIIRGTMSNGQVIRNDSGYAKRYASIGLIMCVISYFILLWYLLRKIKPLKADKRRFLFFVIVIMFIIEYKEPFIYMYTLPLTLLMLSNYEYNERCLQIRNQVPNEENMRS